MSRDPNIGKCKELQSLRISVLNNVETLGGLSGAGKLRSLIISRADELKNIDDIAEMSGLTYLHIRRGHNLSDVNAIAGLEGIQELALDISPDANLDFINKLPNLRLLRIAGQHMERYGKLREGLRVGRLATHLPE